MNRSKNPSRLMVPPPPRRFLASQSRHTTHMEVLLFNPSLVGFLKSPTSWAPFHSDGLGLMSLELLTQQRRTSCDEREEDGSISTEERCDPRVLIFLVTLNALLWTLTGLSLCWATHRQRGLEADRLDVVWPDTVPDWLADWFDSDQNGLGSRAPAPSSSGLG